MGLIEGDDAGLRRTARPVPKTTPKPAKVDYASYQKHWDLRNAMRDAPQPEPNPNWKDLTAEAYFMGHVTTPGALPDILSIGQALSLNILGSQEGFDARTRRYGDRTDPYYQLPGGGVDENKLRRDGFIMQVEEAYYDNKGEVPLDWFIEHEADLQLIHTPLARNIATDLYKRELLLVAEEELEEQRKNIFMQRADKLANQAQLGKFEAMAHLNEFDKVVEQTMADVASAEASGDIIVMAEALRQEQLEGSAPMGMLQSNLPETIIGKNNAAEIYRNLRGQQILDEKGINLSFEDAYNATGYNPDQESFADGFWRGFGNFFSTAGDLIDLTPTGKFFSWAAREGMDAWKDAGATNISLRTEQQEAEIAFLKEQLGTPSEQQILQAGVLPADLAWQAFVQQGGAALDELDRMTGSRDLSEFYFKDEYMNVDVIKQQSADIVEQNNRALEVKLNELEEASYGTGDAVLDVLALYGETMETTGTMVGTGLKYLLTGENAYGVEMDLGEALITGQYWQDVQDYDTPAGVLALEGTLVGLGINIGMEALMSPDTYLGAPGLSRAARLGVRSASEAARIGASRATRRMWDDIARVIRSGTDDAIPALGVLENMSIYNLDELAVARLGGYQNPIRNGGRAYLGKWGPVTDDVTATYLDDMAQPLAGEFSEEATRAASQMVKTAKNFPPVEVTVNPVTGQRAITGGKDTYIGLVDNAIDAIPVTFKVDPDFGLIDNITDADSVARTLAPNGTMTADELFDLRAIDWGHESIPVEEMGSIPWMLEQTPDAIREIDTPLVVQVNRETGEAVLADGNHRIVALRELGAGDSALHVNFEIVGPDEWAKAAKADAALAKRYPGAYQPPKVIDDLKPGKVIDDTIPAYDDVPADLGPGKAVDDGRYLRPRDVIGDARWGDMDIDGAIELYEKAIRMGMDPYDFNRTTLAVRAGASIRAAMSDPSVTAKKIQQYFNPINANIRFEYYGAMAKDNIIQFNTRLWNAVGDRAGWENWQNQIRQYYGKQAVLKEQADTLTAKIVTAKARRDAITGTYGGMMDNMHADILQVELSDDLLMSQSKVNNLVNKYDQELLSLRNQQNEIAEALGNHNELTEVMNGMAEDFNRKHLATHPNYRKFVDEDGLVPWEVITDRRSVPKNLRNTLAQAQADGTDLMQVLQEEFGFIPENIAKAIKLAQDDIGANQLLEDVMKLLDSPSAWVAPATPLEMIAAATGGKKAMAAVTEASGYQSMKRFAHEAHTFWMLDKVLTPRTGIVVSLDEWLRIGHKGGAGTIFQYLEDKAMKSATFISRARQSGAAWNKLPDRWKNRLTALEEYPAFYRQLDRSWLELNGYGYDNLVYDAKKGVRGNSDYYTAARRTAGQITSDETWRAYFKGKEHFLSWFQESTEGAAIRNFDFYDPAVKGRRVGLTAEEAYQSFDNMFNQWMLGGIKESQRGKAARLWREAATAAAEKGSTKAGVTELPDWVLTGFREVTGNKAQMGIGRKALHGASNTLFENPMEYRRGFLAEWVRKSERARLDRLYASQGLEVVPDSEIQRLMRQRHPELGLNSITDDMSRLSQQLFEEEGLISQRMVDELVERKVIAEMENTLYSFQMTSRAGRKSKALFPFGKPWADMWGFWGRELIAKPQLRGWVDSSNIANMGNIARRVYEASPVNPKAVSFTSRMAATDFDLDRIQEDPLVGGLAKGLGLTRLDLSPAIFLPTGGEHPFGTMLPGFGFVPTALAHIYFRNTAPDPAENPLAFRQAQEEWSTFFPGIGFVSGDSGLDVLAGMFLGGGVTNRMLKIGSDLDMMWGTEMVGQSPLTNDWTARVRTNRQVKVMFQSDEFWEEMAELPPDLVGVGLEAYLDEKLMELSQEAKQSVGAQQFLEDVTELMVPVRSNYSSQNDDLEDIWLDSLDVLGLELPWYYDNPRTDDERQEAAAWVKTQFYALPSKERDALVAANRGLAANLVSGWVWTQRAKDLGLPDTELPYRTDGTSQGMALHETYQQEGYIQPITPRELAINVIGTVTQATSRTGRNLWLDGVHQFNQLKWETLPDGAKDVYNTLAVELSAAGELPYRTGEELYNNPADFERFMDFQVPPGVDEEGIPKPGFSIDSEVRAIGEGVPSDVDSIAKRIRNLPLLSVTDEMREMADAIGVPVRAGMPMHEFYQGIATAITQAHLDNPVYAYVGPEYKAWTQPKSAGYQATTELLGRLLDGDQFDKDKQYEYRRVVTYIDEAVDRKMAGDPSWTAVREEAVEQWKRMTQDDAFQTQNPDKLWNDAWGRTLGAVDWTPDEPAPRGENEERVYVREVVDGDTLTVTQGPSLLGRLTGSQAADFYRLRLLGVNAPELDTLEGQEWREELNGKIRAAIAEGTPIYVVRDPDRYGNVDLYGRQLGWLYIGDEVQYMPETMIPRRDN